MNTTESEMSVDDCDNMTSNENCTLLEPTGLTPSYPDYTGWLRFSITSQLIMIMVIFFTNATVLVLVACYRRLRVLEHSFVVSLAIADWLLSFAMIPGVDVTLRPQQAGNKYSCLFVWCSIMFASGASVFSLLALSLDRYLKIIYPLRMFMTPSRVACLLGFAWSYTFLTTILLPFAAFNNITDKPFVCFNFNEVFNLAYLEVYCYVNSLIPFVLMFIMYAKIFSVVLQKLRTESNHLPSGAVGAEDERARARQKLLRELKAMKKLSIVLGTTAVSWIPVTGMLLRQINDPTYFPSFQTRVILSTLTYMNSAVNPLLYALRLKPFSEVLSKLVRGRCFKQNAVRPSNGSHTQSTSA